MKQKLISALKIVITVAVLAFILTRVDFQSVSGVAANANLLLLLAALALYFLALVVGAFKWQILVKAQGIDASLGTLLSFSLMGLFFGNVMPSNMGGDVVRAYDLARATHGQAEAAAISVLVDRLMGLCAFFIAAVVTAALAAALLDQARTLTQIEIVTVGAATVFLTLCGMLFSRRLALRAAFLFERGPFRLLKPAAKKVYRALQVYRFHHRALAVNIASSILILILTAIVWFLVGQAVGIHTNFFYFLLFNPLIGFVLLVPISFNGLGPKEVAVVFFFGLIGVAQERSLAMSLLFHVIVVLTSLPGGLIWIAKRRQMTADGQANPAATS